MSIFSRPDRLMQQSRFGSSTPASGEYGKARVMAATAMLVVSGAPPGFAPPESAVGPQDEHHGELRGGGLSESSVAEGGACGVEADRKHGKGGQVEQQVDQPEQDHERPGRADVRGPWPSQLLGVLRVADDGCSGMPEMILSSRIGLAEQRLAAQAAVAPSSQWLFGGKS
jgi:hypothetical protein